MPKFLDGVIDKTGIEKLIDVMIDFILENKTKTSNVIPADSSASGYADIKDNAATVEAVYNAIRTSNHVGMKFVKSTDGKTFEEMMTGVEPSEITFYVFKDNDADTNFDLFIYDAQQGKYVQIGTASFSGDVDLSGYWSKDELDITEYMKKNEFDSSRYVLKEEVNILTVTDVENICNRLIAQKMGTSTEESTVTE